MALAMEPSSITYLTAMVLLDKLAMALLGFLALRL
jgi:hypothetical protein